MAAPALILPQRSPLSSAFDVGFAPLFTETVDTSELPDVQPLVQYQENPVGFFVEVLGIPEHRLRWSMNPGYASHTWDGTPDPLIAMLQGLSDWNDVAVEAATGTQKSYTVAGALLWFIGSWKEARGFTFAPKEEQLRAYMWAEIGKLWPRFKLQFPTAVLTDLRIRMRGPRDGAWGAQGFAVGKRAGEEVSVNAQGMHAEHMLLVYEEMAGQSTAVTEAGENTATAPHNLRIGVGNPDHQLDALHLMGHDQFGRERPGVVNVRISALDHPNLVSRDANIVPGAVSQKSVDRRLAKYGETGRLYRSRVKGISPAEAGDALIKLEWVRAAQARWADPDAKNLLTRFGKAKKAIGGDVANSEDGDEGAKSRWTGAYCEDVVSAPCPDSNIFGYEIYLEMKEQGIDDLNVGIDSVGVGAGAVNELKRFERYVQALGSKSTNLLNAKMSDMAQLAGVEIVADEEFKSPRARWYWRLREDLRLGLIALPPSPTLALDLITPRWGTDNGVIWVEAKEDVIERIGRSPNEGDAVVYGNWVRDRTPAVSAVPKRPTTLADRLKKEFEELEQRERNRAAARRGKDRYGKVLRQG